jgi:hypothetical protein
LLHDHPRVDELWVLVDIFLIQLVDLALGREIKHLKTGSCRNTLQAGFAQRVVDSGLHGGRNIRIWDVAIVIADITKVIEWLEIRLCVLLRARV